MTISEEMRMVADQIEKFSRLYGWKDPARGEWSAAQLRKEANYLDKSIS
jgi:hypothetical protein